MSTKAKLRSRLLKLYKLKKFKDLSEYIAYNNLNDFLKNNNGKN